jgi:anti-sigma factor RsiW
MDCQRVSGLLSADIDGELSTAESAGVAQHVAGCAVCARKRRVLEDTWRSLLHVAPAPVSAGFDEGILRRLRRRHAQAWLAAAAVLLAVLGPNLLHEPASVPPGGAAPTPRVAAVEVPDPGVGLDCGLPGASVCVADGAVVVLAQPNVAFTSSH